MKPPAHPPDSRSMREKAYLYLQRKIIAHELPAGAAISEVSLARELGCSRTPLREAVGQLVAEGLLVPIANRGTVVAQFTARDIAELYDLREALEVYAVGKAAQQGIRAADGEALQRLLCDFLKLRAELEQSGRPALDAAQMQRFADMDLNFHSLLLRAGGNSRILKVARDTRVLINIFIMRRKGHDVAQLQQIHAFHCGIVEALERGDTEAAVRLLGEHIRVSKRERLEQYEEWDRELW